MSSASCYGSSLSESNGVHSKTFAKDLIDVKDIPFVPKEIDIFEADSGKADWGKFPKKMNEPS